MSEGSKKRPEDPGRFKIAAASLACSPFDGSDRLTPLVGKPQLDQRLPRHAESARFTVEGIHHPSREIHVDPLRIGANAPSFAEVELAHDLPAGIKFAITGLRFHKSPPLHPVIVSPKLVEYCHRAE